VRRLTVEDLNERIAGRSLEDRIEIGSDAKEYCDHHCQANKAIDAHRGDNGSWDVDGSISDLLSQMDRGVCTNEGRDLEESVTSGTDHDDWETYIAQEAYTVGDSLCRPSALIERCREDEVS
jgi:hypothetical protein